MYHSAPQSGFGSIVLLLMILVLTVAIGYSVSQINKPSFQPSLAYESDAAGIDTFNLDAILQTGLDGIQNVIDTQISDSNKVLSNPNSTPEQIEAAKALKGLRESDQAKLYQEFGKVEIKDGKPDYTERNKMIEWQWDAAAIKKVAPPRNDFKVDVQNHTPFNDNSGSRATSGIAGAAAAGAIKK